MIPQIRGMYAGDQARKTTLVDYGFRLPSAKDNRPLNFQEFERKISQMLFVSATPSRYEEEHELMRAEQIIRPTGLLDPEITVRPIEGQIDDLISEINKEVEKKNKILVTTLTKRMAEAGQIIACDYVGIVSGNKVPDKFVRAVIPAYFSHYFC